MIDICLTMGGRTTFCAANQRDSILALHIHQRMMLRVHFENQGKWHTSY